VAPSQLVKEFVLPGQVASSGWLVSQAQSCRERSKSFSPLAGGDGCCNNHNEKHCDKTNDK
jgi:hypothetical protein